MFRLHNGDQETGQGYIAQWLEQLTADQQVPGSIPGGDIGSIFIGMFSGTIYEPNHNYNHNANDNDSTKVSEQKNFFKKKTFFKKLFFLKKKTLFFQNFFLKKKTF